MAEGLDRYAEIKLEVAKLHKLDAGNPHVALLASLKLAHERGVERLADNKLSPGDLTAFAKIVEMLKEHEPPILPNVSVTFVEGVVGVYRCQHCSKENELKPGTYTPAPKETPLPAPDTANAKPIATSAAATEPKPQPKPPTHINGKSPSAFHSQIGTPLKRLQPGIHDPFRSVSPLSNGRR